MIPEIGAIYERHVQEDSAYWQGWTHEVRLVLDASDKQVCYERVYPPSNSCIEYEAEVHQVSIRDWNKWAALARRMDNNE